jgi:thioredoxin-dependent peroxiredoxin
MGQKGQKEGRRMVKEGDEAPGFELARDGGGRVKLSDFRGRPVVVYFYPRDDTLGCTRQAIDFSESIGAFRALGAEVIGISPDSVRKHDKFRDKHGLSIILAADPEKEAIMAYGVWAEKKMYGRAYMGVDRSTFLVDAGGRIVRAWRGVKVPGHVAEVLAAIEAL